MSGNPGLLLAWMGSATRMSFSFPFNPDLISRDFSQTFKVIARFKEGK